MRRRGFTLTELLVALLLLAVAISGLVGLWTFAFNTTAHSQDMGVAYSIARQEVERAHALGYMGIPAGTQTRGYDGKGGETTAANPHYTATVTASITPLPGGEVDSRCLRTLLVRVVARDHSEPACEITTHFSRGGV